MMVEYVRKGGQVFVEKNKIKITHAYVKLYQEKIEYKNILSACGCDNC